MAEMAEEKKALDVVDALRVYVRTKKQGDVIDYVTAEQETGVSMTHHSEGRRLLRVALRRERIDFQTIRDIGVLLSSPTNSADFVRRDVAKVLRGAKRGRKRNARLLEKHGSNPAMPENDKQFMIAAGSFSGAVEAAGACALARKPLPPKFDPPPKPSLPMRLIKT